MSLKAAKTYPLELFAQKSSAWCQNFEVLASVKRVRADLLLTYVIRADQAAFNLVSLLDPIPGAGLSSPTNPLNAKRLNELWKTTCFEAFIAFGAGNAYLEFNASREGNWNLYVFTGYRQGMKELALGQIPVPSKVMETREQHGDHIEYKIEFKVSLPSEDLEISRMGLAVILAPKSGDANPSASENGYFALSHPGEKPDFHLVQGWVKIEG